MEIFRLGEKAEKNGYRVSGFSTLVSTNSSAMQAARDGNANRLWIASLAQSKGRGRRGRVWQSEAGNLAASLVIVLPNDIVAPSMLGFVAALALVRALSGAKLSAGSLRAEPLRAETPRIELKWPNDVLANGAKLAGILLEAERIKTGGLAVIAGIGVNIKSAPENLPYKATCLAQLGINEDARSLFTLLSEAFVDVFNIWDNGAGRAQILDEWRANATGMGKAVAVKRAHDEVRGIFEAIEQQGQLVVRQKSGQTTIVTAGDVFFN